MRTLPTQGSPYEEGRHVAIYGINNTYLVGLDVKLLLAHQLGYA